MMGSADPGELQKCSFGPDLGGGDLSGPDDAQSESQRVWRSHSRDGKKVPDEGNHITYSETAGAIKTLAAPPKL